MEVASTLSFRCRKCLAVSAAEDARWTCTGCGVIFERVDGIWRVDAFEPAGYDATSRERLAHIEEDHFWFEAREKLLLRRLDAVGAAPKRVLDLGCGNGRFLAALAARGAQVIGVDAYAGGLERARERMPSATLIVADITRVPLPDASVDLVAMLDVLEHLEPEAPLAEARRLLAPGGRLLVSVPAFQSLYSEFDRLAGHRKRFRRADLTAELAAGGFAVESCTHYQWLLFPMVWLSRQLGWKGRRTPLERAPPGPVARLLGGLNGLEVALWGSRSLPWGSSLVVVARPVEA